MSRHLSTRNISSKSMHALLSNLANRQTNKRIYLLLSAHKDIIEFSTSPTVCYCTTFMQPHTSSQKLLNKSAMHAVIYLQQRRRYIMFSPARRRSFVCLSVCVHDYSKTRAWIWMKCCVSTDVGTWTDQLVNF